MSRGVISYVEQHPEWKTWTFQLSGDRTYYRAGKFFKHKVGDSVEFDTEVVGKNTKASKIHSWDGGETARAAPAAQVAASTAPRSQAEYWAAREARDIVVQGRIELQASRNSAIELVRVLVGSDVQAVKLPAKQADKVRVIEELVSHYTQFFLEETRGNKKASAEKIDPEAAVEAYHETNDKVVQTGTTTVDDNNNDNWN